MVLKPRCQLERQYLVRPFIESLVGTDAKVSNGIESHYEVAEIPSNEFRNQAEWSIIEAKQGYVKDKTTFLR